LQQESLTSSGVTASEATAPCAGRTEAPLLLVIDGHAYAYRAFYAIRRLNAPSGKPTNAIFGFIKTLQKIRAQLQPSHLLVVWDGGLSAARLKALPEYKAQRPPMPQDLDEQLHEIQEYLHAAGIASACVDGVEADDLIATMAHHAVAHAAEVVIASPDKDFMQLVSPRVGLLNPNGKTESVWHAPEVVAKAGVEPEQIVDWLSLVGDSVDNIPGVDGVGPKTAAELLRVHGSVASLYENLERVSSLKLRASLEAARPLVRRNQELVRLKSDLHGGFDLAGCVTQTPDVGRLRGLFSEWGFRGMLAELGAPEAEVQKELF
jgi:DNA polymerase-1